MKTKKQILLLTTLLFLSRIFVSAQPYHWTELNQTFSGTVLDMGINSADKVYILFNSTIYYSVDKGLNWMEYGDNSIGPVTIYLDDYDDVFIGTSSSGLFYSFNDGQTWDWHYVHQAPHTGLSPYIGAIWSDQSHILLNSYRSDAPFDWFYEYPGDPGYFTHFAESQNGLAIGTDSYTVYLAQNSAGTSWSQPANNGLNEDYINDIVADENDHIFLATQNGLFYSDDMAGNFVLLDNGLDAQQINALFISNSGIIYAGTEENGIYKSTDSGDSWTQLAELQEQKIYDLVVTSQDEILVSAGNSGIFYSDDGGSTWANRVNGLPMSSPLAIDFDSDNGLYVESWTGLYYSGNLGLDWNKISQGVEGLLKSLAIDHQDNIYIGLFQSPYPDGNGGVYFSSDHGASWQLRNDQIQTANILKIVFDDEDNAYLLATDTNSLSGSKTVVFVSDDQGINWTKIFDVTEDLDSASTFPFSDMEVTASGDIFIGGSTAPFNAAIVYSHDQGMTWNIFEDESQGWINHIEIAPDNVIYAIGAFLNYYTSDDNGDTWTINSLANWPETDEFLIDHAGNFITSGNNQGFKFSDDQGQSWTEINNGIPSENGYYQIFTTAYDQNDNLFTFTYDGFYTTDVTVNVNDEQIMMGSGLSVALFPNPVKDELHLQISSGKDQVVEVKIYDQSGKVVGAHKISVMEGSQTLDFSAPYASGVYLYSIASDHQVSRGKFIKL